MGYERLWVDTGFPKIDSKIGKIEKKFRKKFGIINDYFSLKIFS
jgi:hypothetical protein